MISLALDFAGPEGQVAIADGERLLFKANRPAGPGTVEGIVPFLLSALDGAGLTAADLDIIAATTGPGSFTGIRAGLAAAQGLALSHGRPVIGLTVFEAIALSLTGADDPILIALDGRRADLFVQLRLDGAEEPGEPVNVAPDRLDGMVPTVPVKLAGSAADRARQGLIAAGRSPAAVSVLPDLLNPDIARLACHAATLSGQRPTFPPEPFYGRAPDARPQR
ncbi:MAG: tRNA (adenosine(37)-N6)-threonylcarbamoyltransferase complex dimerization subunit type 1 TsaB [Pseudomonadota bacterium]